MKGNYIDKWNDFYPKTCVTHIINQSSLKLQMLLIRLIITWFVVHSMQKVPENRIVHIVAIVSTLMNALEGGCLCLREISINVNKLLTVLLLPVYCLIPFFVLMQLLVYFFIAFFILMLLQYFCLLVDHVNQPIFVFGASVYHIKNTISIFVTIL